MLQKQGFPLIEDYNKLIKSEMFQKLERYSKTFVQINKKTLQSYATKWGFDALHSWSRQYEYPFSLSFIINFIESNCRSEISILDAGSGLSMFPYYLASLSPSFKIDCCDNDPWLEPLFLKINQNEPNRPRFTLADLQKLTYPEQSFDVIYCISVLEHTENYEAIIAEFQRVLKNSGLLIITFDVDLEEEASSRQNKLQDLIRRLQIKFKIVEDFSLNQELELINSGQIVTTKYIKNQTKIPLPWKRSWKKTCTNLLRLRIEKKYFRNLTFFCVTLVKK